MQETRPQPGAPDPTTSPTDALPLAEPVTQLVGDVVVASPGGGDGGHSPLSDLVEQPAKVVRIGGMIKQLLDEVRAAPLDERSRVRLREIFQNSLDELGSALAPELRDELNRITLPFDDESVPTDSELRIAQAQLVGWLEGLFHGIQTAMFAQQLAMRAQLEDLQRRALPGAAPVITEAAPPSGPYL